MTPATVNHLDLTPPPVVKKISQRSLVVGVIFSAIAVMGIFVFPNGRDQFYRAYLLGFMGCLGVALGSMAILMIRHLTGGGWGMVIRRILGAAMRTLPLLALLFIPIILGMHRLSTVTHPSNTNPNKHLPNHQHNSTKTDGTANGFILRAVF